MQRLGAGSAVADSRLSTRTSHHCQAVEAVMPRCSPSHASTPSRTAVLNPECSMRCGEPVPMSVSVRGVARLCATRSPTHGVTLPSRRKRSRNSPPSDR
ncbi:hypothetical protein ACN28S_60695 [Cystobacter fuscus]